VERGRDCDLARLLVNGEVSGGLVKALGRLGEVLWEAGDYARFLALFAEPEAGRVLRHMKVIAADRLALIGALPEALRRSGIIAHLPGRAVAVEELVVAFHLARRIHGAGEAAAMEPGRQCVCPVRYGR